ncbi:MAG: nucleotidyltransferase domain-containing protein [Candidatus Poseidoniaceae archaeon]|jgi:DNA polymerase sigma|nr:nucleotidyltransferase domain-containing protein [Candidatus Poseidoniaceae archaeon]
MKDNCEITGLSPEDASHWSDFHAIITGKSDISKPEKGSLDSYEKALSATFSNNKTHKGDQRKTESLVTHLEKSILSKFKDSKLIPFGSVKTGLSLKGGDLDLCFQQNNADAKKVIKRISGMMRGQGMEKVQALTRAKVPIIKFIDPRSGIHVDISINNSLALYNTKLLETYAEIDERVKRVALCVKHWALHRNICDPLSGTLSSYAWSNLVIAHLQLEGLLPNLQESEDRTIAKVDGREYDLTINTEAIVKEIETSAHELLVWFFYRFAKWDWENDVVSIRNNGKISRDEKGWNNENPTALEANNSDSKLRMGLHHLPIEDPFDLEHDLCRVVRAEGELSIKNELIRAVRMFNEGASWESICDTVSPERLEHLEPADLFHDLRTQDMESIRKNREEISKELKSNEELIVALEEEKQSCIKMSKAMRGVIDETSGLRKEHKAVVVELKKRNAMIDQAKNKRDEINSNIILPLHMIEEELAKVYSRLTEEIDLHRVPSLEKEKLQFSWFMELQSMHSKANEASELHKEFIKLVKQQKEDITKLKIFENKHDDTTKKLLDSEPLLKDKNVSHNEVKSHDKQIQNVQKILRKKRGQIHKLRRELGRLDAWIRKQTQPRSGSGKRYDKRKGGRKNKPVDHNMPITLGDISGLLSGEKTQSISSKKEKRSSSKKAGMKKLSNFGAHRGKRSSYQKKD